VLILDFDEASGFRTGRSVKYDVHKHDFIMRCWPYRRECGPIRARLT
jgi:hypothetical protein